MVKKTILFILGCALCFALSDMNTLADHEQSGTGYQADAASKASIGFSEKTYQEASSSHSDVEASEEGNHVSPSQTKPNTSIGIGKLPSTNELKNSLWGVLGVVCLLMVIILMYMQIKRRKKNHEKNH